ncbi:MAG: glutamine-hydrolyzing carbamoyl-phosphate synthase small subunit [archaeon]|nr:glutamine-hydrolyzing carbamoyl-phosphate synthase small subunit [archaeon]
MVKSFLILEDGTVYEGKAFGHDSDAFGEVVFTTEEFGYQLSLTDPSYKGQIMAMTYPLIGNYRIHNEYFLSDRVQASAFVCKDYSEVPADMYPGKTLDEFLKEHKVPAISGIDTRDLTLRIRNNGTMRAKLTRDGSKVDEVVSTLKNTPCPCKSDLVAEVGRKDIVAFDEGKDITVAVLDCGEREDVVRALRARYNVVLFPRDTGADAITSYKLNGKAVEGLVVSNGPGNPAHEGMKTAVATVKELAGKMPVFGLGLGHQIVALAFGASVFKMKFGHHGGNEPVAYNGRTYITSQNHCFAVDADSLKGTGLVADQLNVNDKSVEGMRHETLPVRTVQYLPETITTEVWETSFFFDVLGDMIKEGKQ